VTRDSAAAEPAEADRELLARYIEAFERFDVDALVALLHEDATLDMPPFALWMRGRDEIGRWMRANDDCSHDRFVPVAANGQPAVAVYKPKTEGAELEPFAIHLLDTTGGRITAIHAFLDPSLFELFGLEINPAAELF